jgi:putative Holliday junction resolvase
MRKLGLDLGERRIGVAVSDPTGRLVTPLPPLVGYDPRRLRSWVEEYAAREDVDEVVVGLPRSMGGGEERQARWAREFASSLEGLPGIEITFWDERLTTREALRRLGEAGVRGAKGGGKKDSASAALMLDAYLRSGSGA